MRHRIEIQRLVKIVEDGFTTTEYRPLKKVWAKANGLYGSEKWDEDVYEAERTTIFTIRHNACPDLTVRDRILFRGKLHNITHIDNVLFGNNFVKITAVAVEEGENHE
ncbi:MAG: phage head closure protein [Anaerotignum sp.]|nr:phage head closure protein [Anaerotignum sp.]